MRLLIQPNDLVLGGSSLNAVDLAATLQGRGHHVLVASPAGELSSYLRELGLDHVLTPYSHGRGPDVPGVRAASAIARDFRPDVVHTWEFGPYLSAYFGIRLPRRAQLATVMSMEFPTCLPRTVPVTMGTKALVQQVAKTHLAPVSLLEPPVDLTAERASESECHALAQGLGLRADLPTVVIVSRLARALKAEGVIDTILAMGDLPPHARAQLLIVGDGDSRVDVVRAACHVNALAGQNLVILAGSLTDPRPAYALADVVVGMGSSALRAMAFGKPVIVVGVDGFVKLVSPGTFPHFDREGMFGTGGGLDRRTELTRLLGELLTQPARRRELGGWGRDTVAERYSLEACTTRLESLYRQTISLSSRPLADAQQAVLTLAKTGPAALRAPYVRLRGVLQR